MNDNVNEAQVSDADAMVEMAFNDPELSSLEFGSEEFNAAVANKAAKMEQEDDAPAGDDTDEQEDEDTDDTDEQPEKPKKRGTTKRIDELTAKVRLLERELEQAKYTPPAVEQASTFDKPEPNFDDYNDIKDYTKALARWQYEAMEHERAEQQASKIAQDNTKQAIQTWQQQEADVRKSYADYDDVVNVQSLQVADPSIEARSYLAESDVGPRVIYELMSDPALVEQFSAASPVKQVAMLARLEDRVSVPSEKKTIASKAPTPPRSLPRGKNTASAVSVLQNSHEMSFEDWDRQVSSLRKKR